MKQRKKKYTCRGNTVDETVQRQHLNQYIQFIFTREVVVRLVLFVVLL